MVIIFQTALYSVLFSVNLTLKEFVDHLKTCYDYGTIQLPLPYFKSIRKNWHEAMLIPNDKWVILGFIPFDFNFDYDFKSN